MDATNANANANANAGDVAVHVVSLRVPLPVAALTLAFHLIPHFSNLLYVRDNSAVVPGTCITFVELFWMFAVGIGLLIATTLPPKKTSTTTTTGCSRRIAVGGIPLRTMGWLWFVAACVGPIPEKLVRGELQKWCFLGKEGSIVESSRMFLNHLGAEAAWPALWILGLGAFLPVAAPLYETPPDEQHSYVASRKAHIEAGMLILWWCLAHTILITVAYVLRKGESFQTFMMEMIPMVIDGKWYYTEGIVNFSGWVALFFLWVLWASDKYLRHPQFEFFTVLHRISSLGFILFSNLHDYNTLPFVWPGLVMLLAARLRAAYFSGQGDGRWGDGDEGDHHHHDGLHVTVPCPGIVKLSIRDRRLSREVCPGQHLLLRDTRLSCARHNTLQWHPITVSAVEKTTGRITLHIKDLGDWSEAFVQKWSETEGEDNSNNNCKEDDIEIKGPFGSDIGALLPMSDAPADIDGCEQGVIFVAGGVGITGVSEAAQVCATKGIPFTLVWIVRSKREARALGDDILWNDRLAMKLNRVRSPIPIPTVPSCCSTKAPSSLAPGVAFFHAYVTRPDEEEIENEHDRDRVASVIGRSGLLRTSHTIPRRNPRRRRSAFAVTLATSIAVAIAFLVSRQLCCYRSIEAGDGSKGYFCGSSHQCVSAASDRQCQHCQLPDEIRNHTSSSTSTSGDLPCCTIPRCHICFRGLPVMMVLVLGPILAWVFLHLYAMVDDSRNHYQHIDSEVSVALEQNGHEETETSRVTSSDTSLAFDPNFLISDPKIVTVQYGPRPDISVVLSKMLNTMTTDHYSDEEAELPDSNSDATKPIVFACGPDRLLENVRQQANNLGLTYMGL